MADGGPNADDVRVPSAGADADDGEGLILATRGERLRQWREGRPRLGRGPGRCWCDLDQE